MRFYYIKVNNNKHIKIVTRDRASAYVKAISDVFPDAIQVADRFHLHQNLFEAVKEVLKTALPEKVAIGSETVPEIDNKKDP